MKNFLKVVGIAALVITFSACNRAVKPKTTFTLSINIKNPTQDYILARYDQRLDTFRLDSGKYSKDFAFDQGTYVELQYGDQFFQVFGAEANDLTIEFDATQQQPVAKFTGSLVMENEFVADRRLFDEQQIDVENNLYTYPEEDFILLNDSLRKIREQLLTEAKPGFKSDAAADFIYLEESLIKTKWINRYLEHELYFPLFTEQAGYEPGQQMLAYRNEIDPNNARLLVLDEYLGMLEYFIDLKKKEANTGVDEVSLSNLQRLNLEFDAVDKNISNKEVAQEVKIKWVQTFLQTDGIEGTEDFLSTFIKSVTDPVRRQELENEFAKWEQLKTGATAPEIAGVTMEGDTVGLESYKGKYVYVDFWATWCKPCRDEIPFLEKLMDDMKNDNVAIISVSLDEDAETWARIVRLKKMNGDPDLWKQGQADLEL